MKLSELAFACYLYEQLSDYDKSYYKFLDITKGSLDFENSEHLNALLIWLNKWGCRQFSLKYHEMASSNISLWYKNYGPLLFKEDKNLWELTKSEFTLVSDAYESLANFSASKRKRNGTMSQVSIGSTGAAKILFALKPKALVPWDEPIRKRFGYDNSSYSYINYLKKVKDIIINLEKFCQINGFQLNQLPQKIGRPKSTVPKLIDEYYWITITKNCKMPETEMFQRWINWNQRSP